MKIISILTSASLLTAHFASAQFASPMQTAFTSEIHSSSLLSLSTADSTAAALRTSEGFSLTGFFTDFESSSVDDRLYEGDSEITGATLSYVQAFEALSLGASITFYQTEKDLESDDGNKLPFESDGDGIVLTIGASKQIGDFSLSAVGGWGNSSTDTERTFINAIDSDYDTNFYFLEAQLTYDWLVDENYAVRPSLSVGYQSIQVEGFQESISILLDNDSRYNDIEDDVPYAELSLLAEYYGFDQFVPFVALSVWQDLGSSEVELEGNSNGLGAAPFASDVPDLFETLLSGKIGFIYEINESFDLGASAEYFTGDEVDGFSLGLSATYAF
jgi:hypothetical protein